MPFRTDITIDWVKSPRIITVVAPSVSLSVQDLYDTLRVLESRIQNSVYSKIVSAGGKEILDDAGLTVGITVTLLNAVVAFEARKENAISGIVTTTDTLGITLIDSAATFITDGLLPGGWIVNHTDFSICSIVNINSETQITCDVLGGGTDNKYEIGDVYGIHPVVQVQIAGGNLVALDSGGTSISPVLPTAGTQILISRASTATTQELVDIQFNSFMNQLTIDVDNGIPGIEYPIGTLRQPVNNLSDALTIASVRGINRFFIKNDITVDSPGSYVGLTFEGDSESKTRITINPGADVTNSEFTDATISGTLDGGNELRNCVIDEVNYVDGFIRDCVISGTVTLSGADTAHFLNCFSGKPGQATPTIDMAGSGSALALRNYNGGIKLINKTGSDVASLDIGSGQVIIDGSVVSGTIVVRGNAKLLNSSSTANIIDETVNWWSTAQPPSGTLGYTLSQTAIASEQTRNILYNQSSTITGILSNSILQTGLTHPDSFFDGMNVQVTNALGTVTRRIESYTQVNGTIDISSDPLPFTPDDGDSIVIIGTYMPDGIGTSGFG